MKPGFTTGAILAISISVSLHLFLLNAFANSPPPVLIKGGSIRVEIGLDASPSPATASGGQETTREHEKTSEEKNTAPHPPQSTPEARPKPETPAPEVDAMADIEPTPPEKKAVTPIIPDEPISKAPPDVTPPPEPRPEPTITEPREQSDEAQSQETTTEAPSPSPDGGAASAPSAASRSGDASSVQSAQKAGNSQSENYAGQVMEHLSRVRRPRASVPGSAMIAFTIAASGELESINVAKSSGSAQFDRDAVKMVKRAAPFPKPPAGANREFVVEIEGR